MNWRISAACKGAPVSWWVPSADRLTAYRKARPVCDTCPVQDECLLDAIHVERGLLNIDHRGMRGGLTPDERTELARTLRRPA